MIGELDPRAVLGVALLVIQASLAVPLIGRLWRANDRRGISLTGEMIWIAGGAGWAVYAVLAHSPAVLVSSFIAMATSGVLSVLIWRDARTIRARATVLTVITMVVLAVALIVWQLPGISVALSVFGAVQFIPQIVVSFGQLVRAEATPGVSAVGVGVRAVYTFGWSVWAGAVFLWDLSVADIDWPVLTWGLAGTVAFTLQCAVALRTRELRVCAI